MGQIKMLQKTEKGKTNVDYSSRESFLELQSIVLYLLYLLKFSFPSEMPQSSFFDSVVVQI